MKKTARVLLIPISALLLLSLTLFGVRWGLAKLAIAREWRSGPIQTFSLETTSSLEIIPLYEEASANDKFLAGHGVSYLIRTDSATILMDVGDNPEQVPIPPFVQNMRSLDISPSEVKTILISHGHPDHVGGVSAWKDSTISLGGVSGEYAAIPVFVPSRVAFPGAVVSKTPVQLSPDAATIGLISYPEVFPLSLFDPKGVEQALVVNVAGEGLVLITGCGHPTLERLVLRAESLSDQPVVGVVGGLHYEDADAAAVAAPIAFLQTRDPKLVALSPHDSGLLAVETFRSAFPQAYQDIAVGRPIRFP